MATGNSNALVVGTVTGLTVTVPELSPRAKAAAEAVSLYKSYQGIIDSQETKLFVNGVLVEVKQQRNAAERELKSITDPLVSIRRDALTSKQAAENAYAPLLTHLETAERILKDEILRFEQLVERKRLEEEAAVKRKAEEERRQLEEKARQEAEEAARKNLEEQQRAEQLEREGREAEARRIREQADRELAQSAESVEQTLLDAEQITDNATVQSESIKLAGTSITGKWVAEVVDVWEVFVGIVEKSTPRDAVRVKVGGRLIPVPENVASMKVEAIEINLPWFAEKARTEGERFAYRGMRARYAQDLRVTA